MIKNSARSLETCFGTKFGTSSLSPAQMLPESMIIHIPLGTIIASKSLSNWTVCFYNYLKKTSRDYHVS